MDVQAVLASLSPHQRAALTLRYLDGLPVEDVARSLDKSVHATESLLMRAKAAYRRAASFTAPNGFGAQRAGGAA
jgi:RNA polymerase sigma-70 factor (ECF subfamily)